VIATSGLLLLLSCSRLGGRLECITKASTASHAQASSTPSGESALQDLNLEIGVDGSESMVGFVSQVGSRYSAAIRALEGVVASQGLSDRTKYWRLGKGSKEGEGSTENEPQSITSSQFKSATRPEFYCRGSNPDFHCVSSSLVQLYNSRDSATVSEAQPVADTLTGGTAVQKESNLTPKDNKSLKILITDLEPDSGAIELLVKAYREILVEPSLSEPDGVGASDKDNTDGNSAKAIKRNNKVTLLAVRGEFNGTIFPAEKDSFPAFKYSTKGKDLPLHGRPFYVILSGPEAAVNEISRQIRLQKTDVAQAFQEVSYSSGLGNTISLNVTQTSQDKNNWNDLRKINAFQGKVPANLSEWLLAAINQSKSSKAKSPIKIKLYTQTSPELIGIGTKLSKTAVKVSNVTSDSFSIKNVSEKQGQLTIDAELYPEKFPKGIEALQPTLTVSRKNLNQALWSEWNSETGSPAGDKTQNLLRFLSALESIPTESVNNPVVKICLGINSASSSNPALLLFMAGVFFLIVVLGSVIVITLNRNINDAH
jgi:hypothetical protein